MAQRNDLPGTQAPTPEREAALAARISNGEMEAVHELAMSGYAWAKSLSHKFTGRGVDLDDLNSEAYFGLVEAAKTFDPTRGRFAGYSTAFVQGAIWKAIRLSGRSVSIPKHAFDAELVGNRDRISERYAANAALASEASAWHFPTQLDAPLSSDAPGTAADVLISDARGVEQTVVEQIFLDGMLSEIPRIEREVLLARFELPGACSAPGQAAISAALNIDQRRISEIEKKALARLRNAVLVSDR
ncbi:RNA polymerase sigma-70 factor [marine actinobacterium PHSC20C1]|nr:RNA polymerase sigma-70 factor [marine actinobacterium PHSC20C1]